MTSSDDPDLARALIQRAWEYPVLDAIFQRRARRIPWGAEKPGGRGALAAARAFPAN